MTTRFPRHGLLSLAVTAAAIMSVMAPMQCLAYDEASTSAVNIDSKGVGLRGYDPVAYFTVGAPTEGRAEFTAGHAGVTYQFTSAANRDMFKANPVKYAPQYGGFCAMGTALEKKFDGDPAAWYITDDKLYLNLNKSVQKKWLEDVPGNNTKADGIWPKIRDKTPKSLA